MSDTDYMWARWKFIALRNKLMAEFSSIERSFETVLSYEDKIDRREEIQRLLRLINEALTAKQDGPKKIKDLAIRLRLSAN